MLVKWQKIKEISAIKPEKPLKKPENRMFLIGYSNMQFSIISFLLSESLLSTHIIK